MTKTMSRRTVSLAAGLGAGGFAVGRFAGVAAQDGTPETGLATPVVDIQPVGYASLRVRQLAEAGFRSEVNAIVTSEFVPAVAALEGFSGYLLGDVIEDATQSLSIVTFGEMSQLDAFNALAQEFVGGLDPEFAVETPTTAEGDVLVAAGPDLTNATPMATPVVEGEDVAGGYVAVRIYPSLPDTDPREFAPLVLSGFLPIVQGLPGFQGYLFFPTEGGFTSVSLFDTEESAQESTVAGTGWAAENLSAYTEGNPQVINATIAYSDLPIISGAS
jgi:hypothetical protein